VKTQTVLKSPLETGPSVRCPLVCLRLIPLLLQMRLQWHHARAHWGSQENSRVFTN